MAASYRTSLGDRRLNSLEQIDIWRFNADMKKAGVGPAMADSTFRLLRALLGYAVQDRRVAYNPVSAIAPTPVARAEVRIVTPGEVGRMVLEIVLKRGGHVGQVTKVPWA